MIPMILAIWGFTGFMSLLIWAYLYSETVKLSLAGKILFLVLSFELLVLMQVVAIIGYLFSILVVTKNQRPRFKEFLIWKMMGAK